MREVTVGWTKSDRDTGYSSFSDGYQRGREQHVEVLEVEGIEHLALDTIAEYVFVATNSPHAYSDEHPITHIRAALERTGYRGRQAHYSLSVGDTVTVDGRTVACGSWGWKPVVL
jgi:hypothetical protein